MIKHIKTWFSNSEGLKNKTLNVSIEMLNTQLTYNLTKYIEREIVEKIADDFLAENRDSIKKDILQNPNFANAVYNAIVLRVATIADIGK